jgi:hypothetical protein
MVEKVSGWLVAAESRFRHHFNTCEMDKVTMGQVSLTVLPVFHRSVIRRMSGTYLHLLFPITGRKNG